MKLVEKAIQDIVNQCISCLKRQEYQDDFKTVVAPYLQTLTRLFLYQLYPYFVWFYLVTVSNLVTTLLLLAVVLMSWKK